MNLLFSISTSYIYNNITVITIKLSKSTQHFFIFIRSKVKIFILIYLQFREKIKYDYYNNYCINV